MSDSLGDRMKRWEDLGAIREFQPTLPVIVRLDGKGFHNFTKGLDKPYDLSLSQTMYTVLYDLVTETNAVCGYTQSDEISLILHSPRWESQIYFAGKRDKINSVLASICSVKFNWYWEGFSDNKFKDRVGYFDCRSFQVASLEEACNYLIWREQDATRNSIQNAGFTNFSHSSMQGLNCSQVQEKLFQEKGINWNNYPEFYKRGTYVQRTKIDNEHREYKRWNANFHDLQNNPTLKKLSSLQNRVDFVFYGAEPEYDSYAFKTEGSN